MFSYSQMKVTICFHVHVMSNECQNNAQNTIEFFGRCHFVNFGRAFSWFLNAFYRGNFLSFKCSNSIKSWINIFFWLLKLIGYVNEGFVTKTAVETSFNWGGVGPISWSHAVFTNFRCKPNWYLNFVILLSINKTVSLSTTFLVI